MNQAFHVLLNGVRSPNELTESSRLRIDKVISMWDRKSYIITSTSYTRHKPPATDAKGFPVMEARVAAQALLASGIPRSNILVEESSYDTIGNVYFAMLHFVQPLKLELLTIVSSEFHMPRVRAIAQWICKLKGWCLSPNLEFEAAPDPPMPLDVRRLIEARETTSLANVEELARKVRSVADMCLWLQTEHACYRFDGKVEALPAELMSMY